MIRSFSRFKRKMLAVARRASTTALNAIKGAGQDEGRFFEFQDTENHTYRYKLKNGVIKAYRNKEKLGPVDCFKFNPASSELFDGYTEISLPQATGRRRILPELAVLARDAGVSGLENYLQYVQIRTQPGRKWKVITTRGVYVRQMFSTNGQILDALPFRKTVVEIEAKQIMDQLWVRHEDGWSLVSKTNNDGTKRVLMRIEENEFSAEKKATETKTSKKKLTRVGSRKSAKTHGSIRSMKTQDSFQSMKKYNSMSNITNGSVADFDSEDIFSRLALRRTSQP
mmetsp:Transcript_5230/g.10200  ORF Transcript_5230/g.10200 Transcript_5230/m.10200 type:complete len:283 (-) Transcript_5230:501-1349(-)